jgi:hypothetical protein
MTEKPPEDAEYDVYRHPGAHGDQPKETFKKIFDIYAVGIILIEIARWETIDKIMFPEANFDIKKLRPTQTRFIKDKLISDPDKFAAVRSDAGDSYKEVVRLCITGQFEGGEAAGEATDVDDDLSIMLQEKFLERVVKPLSAIVKVL